MRTFRENERGLRYNNSFARYGGFNSNGGRSSTHKQPHAQSFLAKPDRHSISIAETPQFPPVFRRPIDLPGWHLDADHRGSVAHLPPYRIIGASRIARLRRSDSYFPVVTDWRVGGRPVAPPARGDHNASRVNVAGVHL